MASPRKRSKPILSRTFRRKYARKPSRISRSEKALGFGILALLAAIGAAIYAKGRRFDPAVFGLPGASVTMVKGVDRDVSTAGPFMPIAQEGGAASSAAAPVSAGAASADASDEAQHVPLELGLEGWAVDGKVETFTAETLYEKIDGRADLYQKFDVQRLDFVSYAKAKDESIYVDLYAYDMGEPKNAFGIYAAERSPGAQPTDFGREGYEAAGALFFWKGRHYNLILPSDSSAELRAAARRVAQALEAIQTDDLEPLGLAELLPAQDRVADSLTYLKRDALSQTFLDQVVAARYRFGPGGPILAFVRQCAGPEEAAGLLGQYQSYLDKYGRPAEFAPPAGAEAADGADLGGVFDFVFTLGPFFAGVSQAADALSGRQLAERLSAHLTAALQRRAAVQGVVFEPGALAPSRIEGGQWKSAGPVERFTSDNLYEKIDGQAEQYLDYGVRSLECVSFANAAGPDQFVDLYVYDQGRPLNAFGVYAAERPPNPVAVDLGREGYDAEGSLFFWKGRCYVQILVSEPSKENRQAARRIAWAVEQRIADTMGPLPGLGLLPSAGRLPYSERFILKNALGQAFLDRVFTAQYDAGGGKTLRAFVTVRDTADQAEALLGQYRAYLEKSGKAAEPGAGLSDLGGCAAELAGAYEAAFAEGPAFAGVTEAPSLESAAAFAQTLAASLSTPQRNKGGELEGAWTVAPERGS